MDTGAGRGKRRRLKLRGEAAAACVMGATGAQIITTATEALVGKDKKQVAVIAVSSAQVAVGAAALVMGGGLWPLFGAGLVGVGLGRGLVMLIRYRAAENEAA